MPVRVDMAGQTAPLDIRSVSGLDPVLRGMLIDAQAMGLPKLPDVALSDARAYFEQLCAQLNATQEVAGDASELVIEGPAGPINARLYRQAHTPETTGAILFFHGGGWVLGSIDTHDPDCRHLSQATGWPVLSVDYRLAPEHPFPAALDDARAALAWLRAQGADLGIDPERIVVAGDSAGGNIAAALTLDDRPGTAGQIFGQLLIYPVVADRTDTQSMCQFASGFGLERADMEWFRSHYQSTNATPGDPLHCPLYAESLAGLPPAVVVTAGFDPLHDEGADYAERLGASDTPVEFRNYAALNHGFLMVAGIVPEARTARDEILELARDLCWRPLHHG